MKKIVIAHCQGDAMLKALEGSDVDLLTLPEVMLDRCPAYADHMVMVLSNSRPPALIIDMARASYDPMVTLKTMEVAHALKACSIETFILMRASSDALLRHSEHFKDSELWWATKPVSYKGEAPTYTAQKVESFGTAYFWRQTGELYTESSSNRHHLLQTYQIFAERDWQKILAKVGELTNKTESIAA